MEHSPHFQGWSGRSEIVGKTGFVIVSILWVGLLLGVSFLATPAKFMAPSLTLPIALDVGRHTFAIFNYTELGLLGLLMMSILFVRRSWTLVALVMGVCIIVMVQTLWVLPVLDARVGLILDGGSPPPSSLHIAYIGIDVLKLILLTVLAFIGLRRLAL